MPTVLYDSETSKWLYSVLYIFCHSHWWIFRLFSWNSLSLHNRKGGKLQSRAQCTMETEQIG